MPSNVSASPIRAVLFDLDGTLADTALDLGQALNLLLARDGLPAVEMARIRPIASHGANGLLKLGFGMGLDHPEHARYRRDYLEMYESCFDCDTVLFDGINAVLITLQARGLPWGIITNKPQRFTDRLVPKLGFAVPPRVVVSGDTTDEPKPSVKPMLHATAALNIAPENCLYIGDAERDMQAGRDAGMRTVLVRWGYIADDDDTESWAYDMAIDKPSEILDCLG
ncbi:MAG: HAD family hydrolase [Neisseria sp.]|nr:HAD family hydrolase [Neisseria sp.]